MIVHCKHCGNDQVYEGKKTYTNCRKCDYKIFFANPTPEDVAVAQGLTKLVVKLETDEDRVHLKPWGDVHVGAPKGQCDWDKAQLTLNYVLNTPNAYLIGMGDYMDCAQRMPGRSGPNLYVSSMSPMEQFYKIEAALKPLAAKGKILGLHSGNHENWIMENTGIQLIDLLCRSLKVPFLGPGCDLILYVNGRKYLGYSQHGTSSARLRHTKLGALMNATKDVLADFFLYGHVHQIGIAKGGKRQAGHQIKTYYVLTGHFLNWEGSYAQCFGLDVCPAGSPLLKLFADRKDVHVSV